MSINPMYGSNGHMYIFFLPDNRYFVVHPTVINKNKRIWGHDNKKLIKN